ncbi:MAG: tRNA lysidine(34) synthetase TilS [Proteobacteria bacterium]|nr:tRNA lysidine(34) synthetase TilS [Pseudomonadota bacterium]
MSAAAKVAEAKPHAPEPKTGPKTGLLAEFREAMDRLIERGAPWPGAVAVSGGADSLALMYLLTDWAKGRGKPAPQVLTVDHGLRSGSDKDAEQVAKQARQAGLKAHVLVWKGAKPKSGIESEAREARYRLMGEWLKTHQTGALYVAHSEDDQAETFLLRLARGSGLDGLSAMQPLAPFPVAGFEGLRVVRPLLEISRKALREWLAAQKHDWIEDPMNDDPKFARVRLRKVLPQLAELGLSTTRIADAASHLSRAREALDSMTDALLSRAARFEGLAAVLDPLRLKTAPREIGLRALASVLSRVSGEAYRPRFERLERLFDSILAGTLGGGATLHGCRIGPAPREEAVFGSATLTIAREKGRSGA